MAIFYNNCCKIVVDKSKEELTLTAKLPTQIEVRGGRVHNLKNIDVNIPLHKFVAISGLSGSGKSSLAMGILYEEGSRRYLDALSTYMRRRIKQEIRRALLASSIFLQL